MIVWAIAAAVFVAWFLHATLSRSVAILWRARRDLVHSLWLQARHPRLWAEAREELRQETMRPTVIGRKGSTGNSSGPHLHFEAKGVLTPKRESFRKEMGTAPERILTPHQVDVLRRFLEGEGK